MTVRELAEVMTEGTFVAVKKNNEQYVFSGSVENIRGKRSYWVEHSVVNVEVSNNPHTATVITLV